MDLCGLVARLGNSGRGEENRDARVLGLQGLVAPHRLWLTTGWPRLRGPGCRAGPGGPQQNSFTDTVP